MNRIDLFHNRETALALFVATVEASRVGANEIGIPHLVVGLLRTASVRAFLGTREIDVVQVAIANRGTTEGELSWLLGGTFNVPPEEEIDRELDGLLNVTEWRTSSSDVPPLLATSDEVRAVLVKASQRASDVDAIRPLDILEAIVRSATDVTCGLEMLHEDDFQRET